jgi:Domain of unknown function (DUF4129)
VARSGNDIRRPGAPGALPAVAAGAALVLAALGLRLASGSATRGQGPLAAKAVLIAVPFGVVCAIAAAKYHTRVRYAPPGSAAADRMHGATVALLSVCAILIPVSLLMFWRGPDGTPPAGAPQKLRPSADATEPTHQPTAVPTHPAHPVAFRLDVRLLILLIGVILALLLAGALVWLVLRLLRAARQDAVSSIAPVAAPPEQDALAEALDAARGALTGTDARAAIIACYRAMEVSLAESGIERDRSDTPADLLARAARGGVLGGAAPTGAGPGQLADLFREARFSSHPMGAGDLERARAALDATTAHLAERRAGRAGAGAAAGAAGTPRRTGAHR